MKIKLLSITLALVALSALGQAQQIHRTEIAPYAMRDDAKALIQNQNDNHIKFAPQAIEGVAGAAEQSFAMPQSWVDATVYIHLEGVGAAYTLYVNGREVALCDDSFTPRDYDISKFVGVGENSVVVVAHRSQYTMLEEGLEQADRTRFEGSYIYTQEKLKILDYSLKLVDHTEGQHGQLFIDVIVENRFNFEETIHVGFDIYAPDGKLLDFSSTEAAVAGNSIDTIRFAQHLYGANKFRWNPSNYRKLSVRGKSTLRYLDQSLYSVMLFTKRNRVNNSYIPFGVGFEVPTYSDGKLSGLLGDITLKSSRYTALSDEAQSEKELRSLKQQGFNTIIPDYPQPLWFYRLCDKIGLYVIDQAAISAPTSADDLTVGGTPSNDPKLLNQYLDRVKAMYYRTRNFSCVVGYSLGQESGNGYNMYKAYQWLKEIEKNRPVIYQGAKGEWNSDPLNIE